MNRFTALASLPLIVTLGACAADTTGADQSSDEAQASVDQPLYGLGTAAAKWPNGIVPVCFENPADHPELQVKIRGILKSTWSKFANVTFTGFGACSGSGNRVKLSFLPPGGRGVSHGIGAGERGIELEVADTSGGSTRFRYMIIHEFGHALGFAHEQQRTDNWDGDTPRQCGIASRGDEYKNNYAPVAGGTNLTAAYDVDSVMNYCNPLGNPDELSAGDIAGAQSASAYGPPLRGARTGVMVAPFFLGQNGPWQANGMRMHSLLPTGSGAAMTFAYQDINSGYGANDMANWRVAGDLNRDGRPDLVGAYYLGQNGAGSANGLRIHTALSTGPGTYMFAHQDINSAYGANDMANWKVAGDLNGDGRADLVDTYYLGQNGAGQANGLRIHTALSTGPGTWSFTYQDINSDYGANDMGNWKVAGDLNGDGRPDLIDTYYLGQNGPGRANGLRIHTALSTGPGTWRFVYQDIEPSYGANDMANWKVAGDLNGDGRSDLVDTYYLGQNGPGRANGMRVHTALSTGPGTWAFTYQDVNPAYGAGDMANWKVGDINADGRSDLVAPHFRGVGYGLRMHSLISTGPGTWTFTYSDINSGYGADDMANWKVMDIDGDGLADMVDTYYLGQNGAGRVNGLRLHTAISRGDGTWRFGYQDVNPNYGANDMATWKVGGLVDRISQ